MKINALIIALLLFQILLIDGAVADIVPFDYTFTVPTSSDISQEEAEKIADAYFATVSDRIIFQHEDISQYKKAVNFIRIQGQDQPMFCWAIAYNDGVYKYLHNGFAGMILINSPEGRILGYYCNTTTGPEDYVNLFSKWEAYLTSTSQKDDTHKARSRIEALGMIDLLALPEDNRIKNVFPDLHMISEEEAMDIANRLIAGYQHITTEDVESHYRIQIELNRDLAVSDYPIWKFSYTPFEELSEGNYVYSPQQYTIAIYAHTGTVWYVIDHHTNEVITADHSYCKIPIEKKEFSPYAWEKSYFGLLFGEY